jgi:hypothetical protein
VGQRGHCKSRSLCFFLGKRKGKLSVWNRIFVHHRIISAVVNNRMSYNSSERSLL